MTPTTKEEWAQREADARGVTLEEFLEGLVVVSPTDRKPSPEPVPSNRRERRAQASRSRRKKKRT